MIGSAASKMFEGGLFIMVRRPVSLPGESVAMTPASFRLCFAPWTFRSITLATVFTSATLNPIQVQLEVRVSDGSYRCALVS